MSISGLIEKFRSVALDRVEKMNSLLVELEHEPDAAESRQTLLREAHTLKGEARMLGFADINLVAHFTEHLLLDAEGLGFKVEPQIFAMIFTGLDMVRSLLTKTAGSFSGPIDLTGFVEQVVALRSGADEPPSPFIPEVRPTPQEASTGLLKIQSASTLRVDLARLERLSEASAEMLLLTRRIEYRTGELRKHTEYLDAFAREAAPNLPKSHQARLTKLHRDYEVSVSRLRDELHHASARAVQVDDETRHMRHVPVAEVLSHYPRAIRDIAHSQGKRVRFVHAFGDVQVDRLILGGLSDPLLHLVRNAVDHGIESPEERLAAGKDEEGEIRLEVEYAGDAIQVTLSDDGNGMDVDAIKARGIERGFITAEEAESLNPGDALALIFRAGFTTRDAVTELSGRGLGMDIVRREVAELGGNVEVDSEPGKGTTFKLWIPVLSAVSSMLIFVVAGQRFAVPAKDVERVLIVAEDEVRATDKGWEIRFVGEHIPVVDFSTVMGLPARPLKAGSLTMMVLSRGRRRMAAWVDDVIGEREAMSRPLGDFLSGATTCRGLALTDSGDVVPILNLEVALEQVRSPSSAERLRATISAKVPIDVRTILVVEDSEVTRTLVTSILRGLGHRVIDAEDGSQAVRRLRDHRVDLVLSDVQMPGMSGLDLLEHIRANPKTKHLPVVMLTTLGSMEDRERALRLGADGYLTKLNFQEKDLIRIVQRYLGV